MAISYRHLIFTLLVSSIGLAHLKADLVPPAPKQIEVQFTVFGTHAYQGFSYVMGTAPKPNPVRFYSVTLSSVYKYKGDQEIKFYDETQLAAALDDMAAQKRANPSGPEPELKIKPVATCSIPDGMKKAVLLFFPRKTASADGIQCDVFALDMGVTSIPAGSMVIINASGREFFGQVNDKIVKIEQGVSPAYKAERGKIMVKMARMEPEYQNVVCGDKWSLAKNQRRLWILFPYSNSKDALPDARCLMEQVPVEDQGVQTASINN